MMVHCKSVLLVFLTGILSSSEGQMSTETVEQIGTGIDNFKGVVDTLETVSSNQKMIANIQQLSGFLGVAGGVVSFALIFLPQQDSAELKFMKQKFSEVNMKLDKISAELDNVKDLITLETQRAAYITAASKILFGYKRLTINYLDDLQAEMSCSTSAECLRKRLAISESYVQDFNVKASLFQVLTGTAESTSVFGDPLLDLIKTTYKCDINKVLNFANGVIKLAFKGQQAVLAYEKLTGTNTSISSAMRDWSAAVYKLRKRVDDIKSDCYQNIDVYMKQDVEDTIFQTNMGSNEQAAKALKNSLDEKYPWIFWTVVSYGAFGGSKHWGFSSFLNMPSSKDARKRVLRVIAQDRGTYSNQRQEFSSALEKISKDTIFTMQHVSDAHKIFDTFKAELQKTTVWSMLSAFIVLRDVSDLKVAIENEHSLYYYNDVLLLRYSGMHGTTLTKEVRFWASFKSSEEIDGISCSKSCSEKGSCKIKPYSSESFCFCKAFFNGINCEHYDKISLAASVDEMLSVTAKIPKLTDIYYEVLDMQNQLGVSLDNIQQAITSLDNKLKAKFDELNEKLTSEFQWSNLLTQYTDTFTKLTYYLHRFQSLNPKITDLSSDKDAIALAKDVLSHEHIEKWVFELNHFIVGRDDIYLLAHKPFLFLIMDKHKKSACSKSYKEALDNAWRQIMVLQNQMFVMWAQASAILNEPSDEIMSSYQQTVSIQENFMKKSTCDLKVANSGNLDCFGGFYTYPELSLINTCRKNYYLVGTLSLTCNSGSSECHACNCNKAGSSSTECSDQTGQCPCTNNYYGKTCFDRNCEWTSFGSYGPCTKNCDYGGFKLRTRSHAVTQKGSGKKCSGSFVSKTSCFNGCCSRTKKIFWRKVTIKDFHCSNTKKCVPAADKCDYENDCGDSQDEHGCTESCQDKYTSYNNAGGGNAVYLDRHTLDCGSSNKLIKMFKLQRDGKNVRYHYKCCTLLSSVCSLRTIKNGFTSDGKGKTVYLDRQTVNCGSNGLLQQFKLQRDSRHKNWRYEYKCCEMKRKSRLQCYSSSTSFDKDGGGKNYYLDRQNVSCNTGYFLQKFRLTRNSSNNKIKYEITCCKIKTV